MREQGDGFVETQNGWADVRQPDQQKQAGKQISFVNADKECMYRCDQVCCVPESLTRLANQTLQQLLWNVKCLGKLMGSSSIWHLHIHMGIYHTSMQHHYWFCQVTHTSSISLCYSTLGQITLWSRCALWSDLFWPTTSCKFIQVSPNCVTRRPSRNIQGEKHLRRDDLGVTGLKLVPSGPIAQLCSWSNLI